MDDPAPCPFCGELGVNFVTPETTKWGAAQCGSCGALGPDVRTSYDTGPTAAWHDEALEEWNKRPDPEILPCYLCAVPGRDERCSTSICDDCGRKALADRDRLRSLLSQAMEYPLHKVMRRGMYRALLAEVHSQEIADQWFFGEDMPGEFVDVTDDPFGEGAENE